MKSDFVPPPGPVPTRVAELLAVAIAMSVIVVVFVPLRLWVRGFMVGSIGADDWCIGIATVLSVLMNVSVMVSTKYGAGQHAWNLLPAELAVGIRYNYITQVLAVPCLAMVKVSIGLFLLRLAVTRFYRNVCLGFIWFMSAFSFSYVIVIVFQCTPLRAIWDFTTPGAKCMAPRVGLILGYTYAIFTIFSDFFLVVLPIAMLWHVQIPHRQRLVICGILSMGMFATSASVVKCVYVSNFGKTGDFLWDSSDVFIWTMVEIDVGILTASIPALKPLFRRVLDKTLHSSDRSRGQGPSSHSRSHSRSNGHQLSSLHKSGAVRSDAQNGVSTEIRAGSTHANHYGSSGHKTRLADSESEEGIFGISKHTDVRVDVETISTGSADGGVGVPMGVLDGQVPAKLPQSPTHY